MKKISGIQLGAVVCGIWLLSTRDACAYIDPGSGSYLFQILIGLFTALIFFFTTIKQKCVHYVRTLLGKANPAGEPKELQPQDAASRDAQP